MRVPRRARGGLAQPIGGLRTLATEPGHVGQHGQRPGGGLAAAWTPHTFHRVIEHITLRESLALTNALPAVLPPIPIPLPR